MTILSPSLLFQPLSRFMAACCPSLSCASCLFLGALDSCVFPRTNKQTNLVLCSALNVFIQSLQKKKLAPVALTSSLQTFRRFIVQHLFEAAALIHFPLPLTPSARLHREADLMRYLCLQIAPPLVRGERPLPVWLVHCCAVLSLCTSCLINWQKFQFAEFELFFCLFVFFPPPVSGPFCHRRFKIVRVHLLTHLLRHIACVSSLALLLTILVKMPKMHLSWRISSLAPSFNQFNPPVGSVSKYQLPVWSRHSK